MLADGLDVAFGSFASFCHVRVMSAYPPTATEQRTSRHVSNVPEPEVGNAMSNHIMRGRAGTPSGMPAVSKDLARLVFGFGECVLDDLMVIARQLRRP